jgi:hypothetical protein
LNWLTSEKNKDDIELERTKKRIIREIKQINKKDLFPEPKKLTLWQKIKILILGH